MTQESLIFLIVVLLIIAGYIIAKSIRKMREYGEITGSQDTD